MNVQWIETLNPEPTSYLLRYQVTRDNMLCLIQFHIKSYSFWYKQMIWILNTFWTSILSSQPWLPKHSCKHHCNHHWCPVTLPVLTGNRFYNKWYLIIVSVKARGNVGWESNFNWFFCQVALRRIWRERSNITSIPYWSKWLLFIILL
jgi:hypothetical protein